MNVLFVGRDFKKVAHSDSFSYTTKEVYENSFTVQKDFRDSFKAISSYGFSTWTFLLDQLI